MRLSAINSSTDEAVSALRAAAAAQGRPVTCCRGCSACCYEPVYASDLEVKAMLAAVPKDALPEVARKARAWYLQASAAGIPDIPEPPAVLYRSLRLACPFLNGTECRVYADRPLACRTHLAVGPRAYCDEDQLRLSQKFINPIQVTVPVLAQLVEAGVSEMNHLGVLTAKLLFGAPGGRAGVGIKVVPASAPDRTELMDSFGLGSADNIDVDAQPVD